MLRSRRGPIVALGVLVVAVTLITILVTTGRHTSADRPVGNDGREPGPTVPLVAAPTTGPDSPAPAPATGRLPTTTTPGPHGLPDPATATPNQPLTPRPVPVRPVDGSDMPPGEITLADPDPTIPAHVFDLLPSVRTGAGVGTAGEVRELVATDGGRLATATIKLSKPGNWRQLDRVFDPLFARGGFSKGSVVTHDEANLDYRHVTYQRSTLSCHVIYDATLGPYYQIGCSG